MSWWLPGLTCIKTEAEDNQRRITLIRGDLGDMSSQNFNPSGNVGVQLVEQTALELFQRASLLTGEQKVAMEQVEQMIASMEVDPCTILPGDEKKAYNRLIEQVLVWMVAHHPNAFRVNPYTVPVDSCIETDDLASSGISTERLEELLNEPHRKQLRAWLDQLPVAERAVFVERVVFGMDSRATAEHLAKASGEPWTPEAASVCFRSALCSLANQLAHAVPPGSE